MWFVQIVTELEQHFVQRAVRLMDKPSRYEREVKGSSPLLPSKFCALLAGIGRRARLRSECPKGRGGSNPSRRTKFEHG